MILKNYVDPASRCSRRLKKLGKLTPEVVAHIQIEESNPLNEADYETLRAGMLLASGGSLVWRQLNVRGDNISILRITPGKVTQAHVSYADPVFCKPAPEHVIELSDRTHQRLVRGVYRAARSVHSGLQYCY